MPLTLRDVVEDDLPIFFEHQQDPEANAMAAFPARGREAFISHWRARVLGVPGAAKKTVVVDGEVAGYVASWEGEGKRLVAYWLGRAHWGRGIATAALGEFLSRCETARPVHAFVAARNAASIRVLEKCGFRRVGDAVAGPDGVDELLMRLE